MEKAGEAERARPHRLSNSGRDGWDDRPNARSKEEDDNRTPTETEERPESDLRAVVVAERRRLDKDDISGRRWPRQEMETDERPKSGRGTAEAAVIAEQWPEWPNGLDRRPTTTTKTKTTQRRKR